MSDDEIWEVKVDEQNPPQEIESEIFDIISNARQMMRNSAQVFLEVPAAEDDRARQLGVALAKNFESLQRFLTLYENYAVRHPREFRRLDEVREFLGEIEEAMGPSRTRLQELGMPLEIEEQKSDEIDFAAWSRAALGSSPAGQPPVDEEEEEEEEEEQEEEEEEEEEEDFYPGAGGSPAGMASASPSSSTSSSSSVTSPTSSSGSPMALSEDDANGGGPDGDDGGGPFGGGAGGNVQIIPLFGRNVPIRVPGQRNERGFQFPVGYTLAGQISSKIAEPIRFNNPPQLLALNEGYGYLVSKRTRVGGAGGKEQTVFGIVVQFIHEDPNSVISADMDHPITHLLWRPTAYKTDPQGSRYVTVNQDRTVLVRASFSQNNTNGYLLTAMKSGIRGDEFRRAVGGTMFPVTNLSGAGQQPYDPAVLEWPRVVQEEATFFETKMGRVSESNRKLASAVMENFGKVSGGDLGWLAPAIVCRYEIDGPEYLLYGGRPKFLIGQGHSNDELEISEAMVVAQRNAGGNWVRVNPQYRTLFPLRTVECKFIVGMSPFNAALVADPANPQWEGEFNTAAANPNPNVNAVQPVQNPVALDVMSLHAGQQVQQLLAANTVGANVRIRAHQDPHERRYLSMEWHDSPAGSPNHQHGKLFFGFVPPTNPLSASLQFDVPGAFQIGGIVFTAVNDQQWKNPELVLSGIPVTRFIADDSPYEIQMSKKMFYLGRRQDAARPIRVDADRWHRPTGMQRYAFLDQNNPDVIHTNWLPAGERVLIHIDKMNLRDPNPVRNASNVDRIFAHLANIPAPSSVGVRIGGHADVQSSAPNAQGDHWNEVSGGLRRVRPINVVIDLPQLNGLSTFTVRPQPVMPTLPQQPANTPAAIQTLVQSALDEIRGIESRPSPTPAFFIEDGTINFNNVIVSSRVVSDITGGAPVSGRTIRDILVDARERLNDATFQLAIPNLTPVQLQNLYSRVNQVKLNLASINAFLANDTLEAGRANISTALVNNSKIMQGIKQAKRYVAEVYRDGAFGDQMVQYTAEFWATAQQLKQTVWQFAENYERARRVFNSDHVAAVLNMLDSANQNSLVKQAESLKTASRREDNHAPGQNANYNQIADARIRSITVSPPRTELIRFRVDVTVEDANNNSIGSFVLRDAIPSVVHGPDATTGPARNTLMYAFHFEAAPAGGYTYKSHFQMPTRAGNVGTRADLPQNTLSIPPPEVAGASGNVRVHIEPEAQRSPQNVHDWQIGYRYNDLRVATPLPGGNVTYGHAYAFQLPDTRPGYTGENRKVIMLMIADAVAVGVPVPLREFAILFDSEKFLQHTSSNF